MNHLQKARMLVITLFALGLALGTALILYALKQNINAYLTPAEIIETQVSPTSTIRLGGMVKAGSVTRELEGLGVKFIVTDFKKDILVRFDGILPDLFREGKGVVATGFVNEAHIFIAREILAKHDENYIPKKMRR